MTNGKVKWLKEMRHEESKVIEKSGSRFHRNGKIASHKCISYAQGSDDGQEENKTS
jgi:hypothetical protein